ncbi:hypothetical protein FH972_022305 [Carpinus fangiana]|uniref:Enoyl reductase (ER) domain-containing protein n=1 Tax=Carpinus fangiana TaxID=176857 RepID=A0A5N6KSE4_9ROSI|nr:hypothetical protein FH972_022305 [Carpinus fangiana]
MSVPKTTNQWTVEGLDGFDSLKYNKDVPIPELGTGQVLVKSMPVNFIFDMLCAVTDTTPVQGASLNYRDLIIPKGQYPFPIANSFVPGSDGAGTVLATGPNTHPFAPGDKVLTLFNQAHLGGSLDATSLASGLGGARDGTFRQHAVFAEDGLVRMPAGLNFVEAATLTCAGLTAWNALHGLAGRQVKPGDWVLMQGTGGVSLFAVQFAKAAGARVISTTGSGAKVGLLESLGADHVVNYKEVPEWGRRAKELAGGRGCDHVVEVAGPVSMQQSLDAVAIDGVISIIGFLGGGKADKEPSFLAALTSICTVRGILVGSRVQMEDMCRAVEANVEKLRPVVDDKVFSLEELKEAYEYMWDQKHTGKVCIKIE